MHFNSLIFNIFVLSIFSSNFDYVSARGHRAAKSFKFGQTSVGLNSLPPAAKRLFEAKNGRVIKKSGANRNGSPNGSPVVYNSQHYKSMRSRSFAVSLGNNLAPAPAVNNESDSSAAIDSTPITVDNRSPSYYLKAMNTKLDDMDDLEVDYANNFLKRGLILAGDFEGGNTWDENFMSTLKRFYASLMQRTTPFIPDLSSKWRSLPGESVYKTPRLYTKQKSVDCGNLQMRLKMIGVIYDGHRNRVIKLFDRGSKKTFAYKTYGNPDEFYAEQEKFLWLDHPFFVKAVCHRKDNDSGKAGILFEYVDGTSSMEYAKTATPEQLKMISAQLFLAIEHLHWLGIVHADLKPENVLVTRDGTVQVIDLGFATHLPQSKRRRGTHTTMAPELHYLVPGRVHEAIDWWAYGSTVAMWYGYNDLYKNDDGKRFIPMNWQENQFIDGVVPWRFPQDLRNFLQIFFQPDPNARRIHTKRLLKQVRNDPFFYGVDWSELYGGELN